MESNWAPMLCIDCGGVLTKYGTVKYEGEDIYKATMKEHGLSCFCGRLHMAKML